MRKVLALAVAAVAIPLIAAPAVASHDGRTVEGRVLAPTVSVPTVGLVTRQARCAYLLLGDDSQGLFGYVVPIEEAEADGAHSFSLTNAPGSSANWDVVFYFDLGTCDNAPPPVTAPPFEGPGDESGLIPEGATHAIIVFRDALPDQGFRFSIS